MKHATIRTALVGLVAAGLGMAIALPKQETQEAGFDMEAMIKLGTPGPMHDHLEPLVGEWSMTVRHRPMADAPWEEMSATCSREWILDGRFVEEIVHGEWNGDPFEGKGLIGYDNMREEYSMLWVDNVSTAMMVSTGSADAKGKVITFKGTVANPMTGNKDEWFKSVMDLSGPEHTFTMYALDDEGDEYTSMILTCTRE